MAEYTFEAMVRGYHVNCEIWSSTIGERLSYVWRSIPSKQWFVAIKLTMRYGTPLLERVHPMLEKPKTTGPFCCGSG